MTVIRMIWWLTWSALLTPAPTWSARAYAAAQAAAADYIDRQREIGNWP